MTWKDRLQDASFRGVPFKVEEESAGTGRRVETHEYPNRDKPYTEDLGKITFRPSITAYVVGDDCFDQRDRLIDALNKPGPGTLVHPTYGELKVCVDGEVRVSTSKSEGRIVRFDLKFVEAGELSYPTSGAATAQALMSSCSALDDCISNSFSGFSIDGVADFVQNDVVGNASTMLGYVSDAMKVVDSAVSDAARLLQGDISVLLPPPSSGKNFVEQVQKMWRTGKRLYGNASDLVTMIKTLSGVSLGSDLQPRGVWKMDSKTTATATQQRNMVASTLRTTAISEAAYAVTRGNPQTGTPATDLDDDYFDMLQEELCSVVEASGASLEKGRNDQLLTALRALLLSRKNPFGDIKSDGTVKTALENLGLGEGSALPVGVPVPWPSATPPTGWLKCNGAAFSAEEYPELAKAYPTNKLPDLRGEFIRGWDDGRGVDAGRALLSLQNDSFEAHRHESFFYAGISRNETPLKNLPSSDEMLTLSSTTNALSPDSIDATNSLIGNDDYNCLIEGNKNNKRTATGLSTSIVGAAETRPRNISFNYIVRAA